MMLRRLRCNCLSHTTPRTLKNTGQNSLIFARNVRQLPNSRRPHRFQEKVSNSPTTTVIEPRKDDSAMKVEVDASPESIMLDSLNKSRPGTPTDSRYQEQKQKLNNIINEQEKLKSISEFLLNEIKFDLMNDPNPDEMLDEELDLEQMLEFSFRREVLQQQQNEVDNLEQQDSSLMLKFKALLSILENLLKIPGGLLHLSPEFYVGVFQISQYIPDESLKSKGRFISGSLIYKLKRFELDILSESQYIESLMLFGNHREAELLLRKNCEKVNQRWWYELMIVNYIDIGNLNEAENLVELIKTKFHDDYLDSRIYLLFINRYIQSGNIIQVKKWTQLFQHYILKYGFIRDEKPQSPGVNATEEEALEYLNRKDPPTIYEFLKIIDLFLESQILHNYSSELIKFYLDQPNTKVEDLYPLLINFRLEYDEKIKPILAKLNNNSNKLKSHNFLKDFIDNYRLQNELETKQMDFIGETLKILSGNGNLKQLIEEVKKQLIETSKLDSSLMYHLLKGLIKSKKIDKALNLMESMKESSAIMKTGDSNKIEQLIIPPIETKHFLPILKYYGNLGDYENFIKQLEIYEVEVGSYNPIILTQVLSSLNSMKKYEICLKFIDKILIEDLHKSDVDNLEKFEQTRLYSIIWKCLKDISRISSDYGTSQSKTLPNLRFVFMKMIHDKVIPRSKDYNSIISTFLINRDKYGLMCVLQYLGKIHKVMISDESIKLLHIYNNNGESPIINSQEEEEKGTIYSQELRKLNIKGQSSISNTLDPFKSDDDVQSMTEKEQDLIDVTTIDDVKEQDLKWRIELIKLIKSFTNADGVSTLDMNYAKKVHDQFELNIKEVQDVVNTLCIVK